MVCFDFTGEDGFATEDNINHYKAFAEGGAGVVVLEAQAVERDGRLSSDQMGIWSDEFIECLKPIAENFHNNDVISLVQIHHAGLKSPKNVVDLPIAPSDYDKDGIVAREMTMDEIKRVQQSFLKAALRVKKAGFHGIELHGAHGYLIDQFMSPITNKRNDEYGGTIENRMRFALEIVEMIKAEVGEDFILGYRMGGNAPTLTEGIEIAKTLESKGVDLLHVSAGITGENIPEPPKDFPYNWIVYCGTEIKKEVKIPVIVVNGIRTPEQADYIIENKLADFVAVGRGHLVDPNWVRKAESSMTPSPCLKCPKCLWFKNGRHCPGRKAV
ncbi:NADH oxidase [bioreactor metagenome]|uniref:NADH oxidase n=1 Tax=bioreactor metagenome TaxID=1076179 RepID=A0A644ZHI8_9ZZZZ